MTLTAPRSWTRRAFTANAALALAATRLHAQGSAGPLVYMGSTTTKPGDGIHVARWNAATGTLSGLRLVYQCISPGFLAISHRAGRRLLFSGHQIAPQNQVKQGALTSFRIEPSGSLTPINSLSAAGADFVHLRLDHTGQCLIAPNYGAGMILSAKVSADGHLSGWVTQIKLTGHGPIASRQTSPHAHGVAIAPNNRFAYINDLGADRILIYRLNPATAELTPNDPPEAPMPAGSGPRHLAFHPNGRWAYSINELNSTVTFFHWNPTSGALTTVATYPTMPPGGDIANNRAGELSFDRAGRFVYGCNRGAREELLTFSVAPDGRLKLLGRTPLGGKEARHFIVTPDDGYLLVAEQFSDRVAVFARNRTTGLLRPTGAQYPVDHASCVLFA